MKFIRYFLALSVLCHGYSAFSQQSACPKTECKYLDQALTPEERAKDLVSRMTLEEEVSQTMNQAVAIPHLGVPDYEWWSEALHGVARNGIATVFPQAIGMAATFDDALMHRVAATIATEGRAKYNEAQKAGDHRRYTGITLWSPNINIFRDPRWGRGQETFGEDPFLTARLGMEFVRGLQGDDARHLKIVATPKHFAVHSGPELDRHHFNVPVSPHDLEDTYLPAFRATIVDAHAASIMCSYNAIDGAPACANEMLLKQHLREDWKFQGFAVSDCGAVADVNRGHHFVADNEHAAAASLLAGTDLECGSTYTALLAAVKSGILPKHDLDVSVERLFTARFRLGMFDPPGTGPYDAITASAVDTPENRELAVAAARESLVLLKNDGVLPLKQHVGTVAVIGPTADLIEALEGNYNGTSKSPVTPLTGIQHLFGSANVAYEPGSILAEGTGAPIPSRYLRPSATSRESGLKAEFFTNNTFEGEPAFSRIDPKVNFDWNRLSPAPGIPATSFAVRWTGEILPPSPGDYMLSFRCFKRSVTYDPTTITASSPVHYRMYLDDKPVLDGLGREQTFKVTFADTNPHTIRVEYQHASEDRFVDLEWQPPAQPLLDAALAAARHADRIVAVVGLSPNLEGEEMPVYAHGFAGGDRTEIGLPAVQESLLKALASTGKPLVVVFTSGGAVSLQWAQEHANAIIAAWYSGEGGGGAIAQTLTGDNNPAGRLPVTFYRSVADLPDFSDYSMKNRTYRYFAGPVLYPFGFGLSYSHFLYRKPTVSASALKAGEPLTVKVSLRNASKRAGDEVAQLYLVPPRTEVSPRLALQGFRRVHLAAGEKRDITFQLDPRNLSEVDAAGNRSEAEGEYRIFIGGGQPDLNSDTAVHVHVTGKFPLPR